MSGFSAVSALPQIFKACRLNYRLFFIHLTRFPVVIQLKQFINIISPKKKKNSSREYPTQPKPIHHFPSPPRAYGASYYYSFGSLRSPLTRFSSFYKGPLWDLFFILKKKHLITLGAFEKCFRRFY